MLRKRNTELSEALKKLRDEPKVDMSKEAKNKIHQLTVELGMLREENIDLNRKVSEHQDNMR